MDILLETTKVCYKCQKAKSVRLFYGDITKSDGLGSKCKECHKEYSIEYQKKNPDLVKNWRKTTKKNRKKKLKEDKEYAEKEKERIGKYYENNKEKYNTASYESKLKTKYGITLEQKKEMYDQQNGQCFLCKKTVDFFKICVDHCHKTGKVRNLLCGCCNSGLAMAKESIQTLEAMIEYIKKHTS